MLSTPILLLALLGPQTGEDVGASAWGDVKLPIGFHLDLATGAVSNRAPQDAERGVVWNGEDLFGPALLALTPGASERDLIRRGDGNAPKPGGMALVDGELSYELGELGWGYLRVLKIDPGSVSLERAHCEAASVELSRTPAGISWSSAEEVVELSWARGEEEGARWLIERREQRAAGASPWSVVGVAAPPWGEDTDAVRDVVLEYRVVLEGGGMGSRVRAVVGGLADELIDVVQGGSVNALNGEVDGARTDLRVEFINPKGVQIGPGSGVVMRTLVPSGLSAWKLPARDLPGYGPQRYFLSEGRDLALHLPEGLYARLSLDEINEGKVKLRVSTALDGGRILLPSPTTTAAEGLAAGGAVVTATVPTGHEGLGLGEPILILEREQGYQSEEWVFASEGFVSEREALLDETPSATGPCRYRTRVRLGPYGPSAPSAPISVLLGDDGGAQTDEWIREAVTELGQQDYVRRQRAREVLAVVGERARPHLLEVVSSDNPEQAAAARELLSGFSREEESAPLDEAVVPDILLTRASELGLSESALAGFLDPDPMLRAFGALRAEDPSSVRAHLELLAEADPEHFVRGAASTALSLPERSAGRRVSPRFSRQTLSEIAEEIEIFDAPEADLLADALIGAAVEADTWGALISLQAAEDLRASLGGVAQEEAAIARARLILALLRERSEGRESPASFLAAALDVIRDPLIRQRAGRDFAALVFDSPQHVDDPLRIQPGDFEDLASVLDECRRSGRGTHILVPAGVYEASDSALASLRTGGEGVHVVGEGEVVIHASFFIEEGASVILENLHIKPRSGVGVTINKGELVLTDCQLTLSSMGVQATDSLVALSGSVIADPPRHGAVKGGSIAMRFVGMSALIAKDSRIASSASCVHGSRFVFLDTCAFGARDRCAVEGQGRMEVFAERSILYGGYSALSGASTGVIDGVVLESPGHSALRVGEGLHICRDHVIGGDEAGELWAEGRSTGCTLRHR